jgi:hypothetical protein
MNQDDLKRRLAETHAAVMRATRNVRDQREHLAELKRKGEAAESARAQAILEMLEDTLRRRVNERDWLLRGSGVGGEEYDNW